MPVNERCRVSPGESRAKYSASRRFAARAIGWAVMHPARLRASGGPRVLVVSSLHAAAVHAAATVPVGSVGAAIGVATPTAAAAASAPPILGGGVSAGWTDQSREHDTVGAQRGSHAGRAGSVDAPAVGASGDAATGRGDVAGSAAGRAAATAGRSHPCQARAAGGNASLARPAVVREVRRGGAAVSAGAAYHERVAVVLHALRVHDHIREAWADHLRRDRRP